jgi:hypothetical protein
MSDRTSHTFDGAGSALVTTYSTGVSATSDGYACESYDRINVYLTVSQINSAGIANIYCDFSHDGTNWFRPQQLTAVGATTHIDAGFTAIDEAIGYYLVFPNAGKFFRLRMAYVSGTSVVVSAVTVEGKS